MKRMLVLTLAAAACATGAGPAPGAHPAAAAPELDEIFRPAARALDSAVADSAAPGAVLAVSFRGRHFYHAAGRLGVGLPARPDSATLYDLASVTKVVGLTTMSMIAVAEGRLDLDAPVERYVPAFRGADKSRVTIRHLLTHSSGLPAWRPLYKEAPDRAAAFALDDTTPLDTLPGTRFVYSDLGAILLTQVIESIYHERLDSLLARRVFQPLRMSSTRYLPPPAWLSRIAPTENDPWRGRIVRGEVHDENAARMGGVSGHAGLFSSATDLLRFADWLLGEYTPDDSGPDSTAARGLEQVRREELPRFTARQNLPPGSSRALGWDTPSDHSSAGTLLSPESFGHTGFTGTSIWVDPTRRLAIVLLSNRVNPTRANQRWGPVRHIEADLVTRAVDQASGR